MAERVSSSSDDDDRHGRRELFIRVLEPSSPAQVGARMRARAGRTPCSRLPRAGGDPSGEVRGGRVPCNRRPRRRRGPVPEPSPGWRPLGRPALCAVERPLRPTRGRRPSCTRSARRDIGGPWDGDDGSCRRLIIFMSWIDGRFRIPSMLGRHCRIRWAGRTKEEGASRPSRWPRDGGRGAWTAQAERRGGARRPRLNGPSVLVVAAHRHRQPLSSGLHRSHDCLWLPGKQGDRQGFPLHAMRSVRHASVGRLSCVRHKTHM